MLLAIIHLIHTHLHDISGCAVDVVPRCGCNHQSRLQHVLLTSMLPPFCHVTSSSHFRSLCLSVFLLQTNGGLERFLMRDAVLSPDVVEAARRVAPAFCLPPRLLLLAKDRKSYNLRRVDMSFGRGATVNDCQTPFDRHPAFKGRLPPEDTRW